MEGIVSSLLRKEHQEAGMRLVAGEHGYFLIGAQDNLIQVFPKSVNIKDVINAADQELNWQKSGISFEREE